MLKLISVVLSVLNEGGGFTKESFGKESLEAKTLLKIVQLPKNVKVDNGEDSVDIDVVERIEYVAVLTNIIALRSSYVTASTVLL